MVASMVASMIASMIASMVARRMLYQCSHLLALLMNEDQRFFDLVVS
ncbi:hypothetical protein [Bartonella birtlesii]|nr:hypothetical protein [Bartonella birtlesii]